MLSNIFHFLLNVYIKIYMEKEEFLKILYNVVQPQHRAVEASIDHIMYNFDWWLLEGKFELCDEILKEVDVNFLSSSEIVALLSITFAARNKLNKRLDFYERAYKKIETDFNTEKAQRLMPKYK